MSASISLEAQYCAHNYDPCLSYRLVELVKQQAEKRTIVSRMLELIDV
ncbi:MAG: hypothetical protein HQ492_10765 [Woeseiaceae bacterium]|nr:hypothetical protein [Woeseiaceae bacterium]